MQILSRMHSSSVDYNIKEHIYFCFMMYLMFILSLCVDSYPSVDLQFWMCSLWYVLFLAWGGNKYHTIYGVTMTKGFTVHAFEIIKVADYALAFVTTVPVDVLQFFWTITRRCGHAVHTEYIDILFWRTCSQGICGQ